MISEAAIMGKLRLFAKTEAGRKKMDACVKRHQQSGKPFASGEKAIDEKEMAEAARLLIAAIQERMPESIASVGGTLTSTYPKKLADGSYEVEVRFDTGALHRDSLYSEGYDGVNNIVALLNNGYHAGNYVYGWWDGHAAGGSTETVYRSFSPMGTEQAFIRSRKDREGLRFMQQAVADFNAAYGEKYKATAVLGGEYTV